MDFFSTNSLSWECLDYEESTLNNLHYGLIHQGLPLLVDMTTCDLPNIKLNSLPTTFTLCQDGDIVFADASEDTNDIAKAIEFVNCANRKIICGLHTLHARDKLKLTINGFKGFLFASKSFTHQIRRLAQGTKVFSVSPKTFRECFIEIPSKDEQSKIVLLLSNIDKKIALECDLLQRYNEQKSNLIANLFI